MMLDKQLIFSDAQVLAATGNSTDVVDFGSARNLGSGARVVPVLTITAKSGTTPTLRAVLVGADDSAFSTNKITLADTGTLTDPSLGAVHMAVASHTRKQYTRVEYTLGGTSPGFTVTAGLALNEQTAGNV